MNLSLYIAGNSFVHRAPIGIKFLTLIGVSSTLFMYPHLWLSLSALLTIVSLFIAVQFTLQIIWNQIKPIVLFLMVIFLFQWYFENLYMSINVVVRLLAIVLFASLLTLTTKSSVIIESIERNFKWLRYVGVNPQKLGLTISLALRFIPVLYNIMQEVREAQKVRGLELSVFAIAIPVIIRTLKMADDISMAIDSRAFDSEE